MEYLVFYLFKIMNDWNVSLKEIKIGICNKCFSAMDIILKCFCAKVLYEGCFFVEKVN